MEPKGFKIIKKLLYSRKMENVKSYVEALDPSVSERFIIVKKPLEGLQNAKPNF